MCISDNIKKIEPFLKWEVEKSRERSQHGTVQFLCLHMSWLLCWQMIHNLHRRSWHQMCAQKMFVWASHHVDPRACMSCPRCQWYSSWNQVTERWRQHHLSGLQTPGSVCLPPGPTSSCKDIQNLRLHKTCLIWISEHCLALLDNFIKGQNICNTWECLIKNFW